jgi:hypothetical protein
VDRGAGEEDHRRRPVHARAAKEAGLIDRIAYADGFEDGVKGTLKAEKPAVEELRSSEGGEFDFTNPFDLWKLLSRRRRPAARSRRWR